MRIRKNKNGLGTSVWSQLRIRTKKMRLVWTTQRLSLSPPLRIAICILIRFSLFLIVANPLNYAQFFLYSAVAAVADVFPLFSSPLELDSFHERFIHSVYSTSRARQTLMIAEMRFSVSARSNFSYFSFAGNILFGIWWIKSAVESKSWFWNGWIDSTWARVFRGKHLLRHCNVA